VLAAPVLSLRLGFSDEGNFGTETTTRRAYDMLSEGFGPGFNGPLVAVVQLTDPAAAAMLPALSAAIGADPGVAFVSPPIPNDPAVPGAALIQIIPTTAPQDKATSDTINRLRNDVVPTAVGDAGANVYITGSTAASMDFTSYLSARLVTFIGVVLLLSFLLLMMVFRSLLVPLKAVIMNVLSIAAAYGGEALCSASSRRPSSRSCR
jgi:RND superfamily putative drug exporter